MLLISRARLPLGVPVGIVSQLHGQLLGPGQQGGDPLQGTVGRLQLAGRAGDRLIDDLVPLDGDLLRDHQARGSRIVAGMNHPNAGGHLILRL